MKVELIAHKLNAFGESMFERDRGHKTEARQMKRIGLILLGMAMLAGLVLHLTDWALPDVVSAILVFAALVGAGNGLMFAVLGAVSQYLAK